MDGEIPNVPNATQPEQTPSPLLQNDIPEGKGKQVKPFALLKAIPFEVFFVGTVLFFGVLNYFNILPLSKIFPNQLGWLPHRPYQQQSQQYNPVKSRSNRDNGAGGELSSQAKQTLVDFLPTILNPSLLPTTSDIAITQTKSIKESFSTSWDTKEGTLSAILVVSPDGKNIVQLYLSFLKPESASPSGALAKVVTSQFFSIQPKSTWGCKPIYDNSMTFCENFWEEENGVKRGVGLAGIVPHNPKAKTSFISFCELSKQSRIYSWKSCAFELKETGVG